MVSSDHSKTVILSTALPALLLACVSLWQWRSTACAFRETAPGSSLYVCQQRLLGYELQPALIRVQRQEGWLWGRRQVYHWVLVDAGTRDSLLFGGYASSLVNGVKRRLAPARRGDAPGQLELIVLTHAHTVGALLKLMAAYPDAKVAAHAGEQPYLVGSPPLPYINASTTPLVMRAAGSLGLLASLDKGGVPPERMLLLHGQGGDLADTSTWETAKSATKKALNWLPRGVLSFVKAAGHTPGSIALIHTPSGAMLAGDAVSPAASWIGRATGLAAAAPGAGATAAAQQAAAKRLVMQDGYQWLLPFHGGNFSRARAQELVQSWPDHAPPEVAPKVDPEVAPEVAPKAHHLPGADAVLSALKQVPEALASRLAAAPDDSHDAAAAGLGLSPGEGGGHHTSHRSGQPHKPAGARSAAGGSGGSDL